MKQNTYFIEGYGFVAGLVSCAINAATYFIKITRQLTQVCLTH